MENSELYLSNVKRWKLLILETAVQDDKVMQDFKSESFVMVGDHSQMVKAPAITNDSGLKDYVNLSPSTAIFRLIPGIDQILSKVDFSNTQLHVNQDGEENLIYKDERINKFIHSEEGAYKEARKWFDSLDLNNISTLFVFGIGLGYAYEAAEAWLREDETRRFIFLEDNLEIIQRFLHTKRASRFLHDKQVWMQYTNPTVFSEYAWHVMTSPYSLLEYRVSALPFYSDMFPERLQEMHSMIAYCISLSGAIEGETRTYGQTFFTNFYKNLLKLPASYQASGMFNQFKGVPAIVCGAGPSLDKNLKLLETLSDRALIFAGATAMNAVNSNGFMPHFGVGIDPNQAQWTRLIANKAYQVPFLYRSRMNFQAFQAIHGDPVYVVGSSGYAISEWFEKEMNISGLAVNEGCNVVNFSLALAHAFGCNPIILVGVDLAYTDKHSYYSGVMSHPTHSIRRDFSTKSNRDELLVKDDIYGNPVHTQWKWLAESSWYSEFSRLNPDLLIINATEGGIGMPGIPNKPLSEVVEHLLLRPFDLYVRTHGEIQNGAMPSQVSTERIEKLILEMLESLKVCKLLCKNLQADSEKNIEEIRMGETNYSKFPPEAENSQWKKMQNEIAFAYILKDFNASYVNKKVLEMKQLDCDASTNNPSIYMKKIKMDMDRYKFLEDATAVNEMLIKLILQDYHDELIADKNDPGEETHALFIPKPVEGEKYEIGTDYFILIDPELKLNFHEKYTSLPLQHGNGKEVLEYPSGASKIEQYFLQSKLHGPVTFFSPSGKILARSWYVKGVRQGKAWFYYSNGNLYGIQRFYNGHYEGLQEYYYLNGKPRTLMSFSNGKFDGQVHLYHPNGRLKRELYFKKGLKQGLEKIWDQSGLKIVEAEYKNDKPVGKARAWYSDGQLEQELIYDENGQQLSMKQWNQNGMLIPESQIQGEDFFDAVASKTELLTHSLDTLFNDLQKMVSLMPQGNNDFQNEFLMMKKTLEDLHKHKDALLFEAGVHGDNPNEPIWKGPTIQKLLQKQLQDMTGKFSEDLKHMHDMTTQMKIDSTKKSENEK